MNSNIQISSQDGCKNLEMLVKLNQFAKSMYEANPLNSQLSIMNISEPKVQEFLKSLHSNNVRYMLVGGVATVFHGHVRTTQDLDIWVQETKDNKSRLVQALKDVDVPGTDHYETVEMMLGWSSLTIGENGFVADFMSYMKAFKKEDFDDCYKRARKGIFDGVPITVIHINDLIKEKMQLARPKDIDDVENLKRIELSRKKAR